MRRLSDTMLILGAAVFLAACTPSSTISNGVAGPSQHNACDGWPLSVYPGEDQCFKGTEGTLTTEYGNTVDFPLYRVTGRHDNSLTYSVKLRQATGYGYFNRAFANNMMTHMREKSRWTAKDISDILNLGDAVYITYTAGSNHCMSFARERVRRFAGYAAVYYGDMCVEGMTHPLSEADVAKFLDQIKGDS